MYFYWNLIVLLKCYFLIPSRLHFYVFLTITFLKFTEKTLNPLR